MIDLNLLFERPEFLVFLLVELYLLYLLISMIITGKVKLKWGITVSKYQDPVGFIAMIFAYLFVILIIGYVFTMADSSNNVVLFKNMGPSGGLSFSNLLEDQIFKEVKVESLDGTVMCNNIESTQMSKSGYFSYNAVVMMENCTFENSKDYIITYTIVDGESILKLKRTFEEEFYFNY